MLFIYKFVFTRWCCSLFVLLITTALGTPLSRFARSASVAKAKLEEGSWPLLPSPPRCSVPAGPTGRRWQGAAGRGGPQGAAQAALPARVRGEAFLRLPVEELLLAGHGQQGGGEDPLPPGHLYADC